MHPADSDCNAGNQNGERIDVRNGVTGNQEYIKIGNEATSKIATTVHQKR